MNLYDQLLKLQVIEDAYDNWTGYRKALTDFILETTDGRGSIAVFGAGRCNDLDLNLLASHFDEVVLIDKDEEAMAEGISKQLMINRKKIRTQKADFVGISHEDYRYYADLLVSEVRKIGLRTEVSHLAEVARKCLYELEKKAENQFKGFGEQIYEVSVAIGVHSQLISMLDWIWTVILQTIGKEEQNIRNQIIELNDKYVQRFNDNLIKATKQNIILGCEIQRVGKLGSIQGAAQAISDMNRREEAGEIERKAIREMQWPFNEKQGINYHMLISNMKLL